MPSSGVCMATMLDFWWQEIEECESKVASRFHQILSLKKEDVSYFWSCSSHIMLVYHNSSLNWNKYLFILFFMKFSVSHLYSIEWDDDLWIMNCKLCKRKALGLTEILSWHWSGHTEENHKNFSQDGWCLNHSCMQFPCFLMNTFWFCAHM